MWCALIRSVFWNLYHFVIGASDHKFKCFIIKHITKVISRPIFNGSKMKVCQIKNSCYQGWYDQVHVQCKTHVSEMSPIIGSNIRSGPKGYCEWWTCLMWINLWLTLFLLLQLERLWDLAVSNQYNLMRSLPRSDYCDNQTEGFTEVFYV